MIISHTCTPVRVRACGPGNDSHETERVVFRFHCAESSLLEREPRPNRKRLTCKLRACQPRGERPPPKKSRQRISPDPRSDPLAGSRLCDRSIDRPAAIESFEMNAEIRRSAIGVIHRYWG